MLKNFRLKFLSSPLSAIYSKIESERTYVFLHITRSCSEIRNESIRIVLGGILGIAK